MAAKVEGKVRIGVIGCGGITARHAKGYLAHADRIEVVALCDVSEEKRRERAEQLGAAPREFSDWKAMIAEMGDEMNAVDVSLPHHLHTEAILDAVAAGKHIFCEKPMCIDLGEADRICEAIDAAGVTYMSAHNQLFQPCVREARRRIEAGEIGTVQYLRCQDGGKMPNPARIEGTWRAKRSTQGGGELIDTGYHPTYRLLYLAGPEAGVVGVRASMGRFHLSMEGEDTASVQVRFDTGAIGEILTSWGLRLPFGHHQVHVCGSRGQVFGSGARLHLLPEGGKAAEEIALPEVDMDVEQVGHLCDCLLNGKRPIHSAEEGRQTLRIILEATADAEGWQRHAQVKM